MILVDTGPFVALFDPKDRDHKACRTKLSKLSAPLITTVPVLTESFHLLQPDSQGADNLKRFVAARGVAVWFMDDAKLARAFALMREYSDRPMDLADASLVTAAEELRTRKIFTLDERDFRTYRATIGHRRSAFSIV